MLSSLFHIDRLAIIMLALIGAIGLIIWQFSRRYLQGDQLYRVFFQRLACLLASLASLVITDNLIVFLISWGLANYWLVKLMVHKSEWSAAKAAGELTGKSLGLGFASLVAGFTLLYWLTGTASIQAILLHNNQHPALLLALGLILFTALIQSAIWPFSGWLKNSLNSPTPVSAIMHAGLVNGGGFLLVRFAPLYLQQPLLLQIIFVLGITSAVIGTLWKLLQPDIKRMLACSTMAQMGFMLAQCGLGLFPAAVAHLCWHGLFKAYLFLGAGGAAQEKRLPIIHPNSFTAFALALLCGLLGSYGFALASQHAWLAPNSILVLQAVASIAAAQLALTLLQNKPWQRLPLAVLLCAIAGGMYGGTVGLVEQVMAPLQIFQPQSLNALHISAIVILAAGWLGMLFSQQLGRLTQQPFFLRGYVLALNASQPSPATITAHRNHYRLG